MAWQDGLNGNRLVLAKVIDYTHHDENMRDFITNDGKYFALFEVIDLENNTFITHMPDPMCTWSDTQLLDLVLLEIDQNNWVTDIYPKV